MRLKMNSTVGDQAHQAGLESFLLGSDAGVAGNICSRHSWFSLVWLLTACRASCLNRETKSETRVLTFSSRFVSNSSCLLDPGTSLGSPSVCGHTCRSCVHTVLWPVHWTHPGRCSSGTGHRVFLSSHAWTHSLELCLLSELQSAEFYPLHTFWNTHHFLHSTNELKGCWCLDGKLNSELIGFW